MSEFEGKYKPPEVGKQPVEQEGRIPLPSEELAWMLGVLSGGGRLGYVRTDEGRVVSPGNDMDLAEKFARVTRELFGVESLLHEDYWGRSKASLYSGKVVGFLGNLGRDEWPSAMESRFGWIREDEEFVWAYLNGCFDVRGSVSKPEDSGRYDLTISSASLEGAVVIGSMFTQLGFKKVSVREYRKEPESGSMRVSIYRAEDIRRFANKVVSCVKSKDERLNEYRDLRLQRKELKKEEGQETMIDPSTDLAWMLGVLSGGGSVDKKRVAKFGGDIELMKEFQRVGEMLLKVSAPFEKSKKGTQVVFRSARYARFFGDLRLEKWPETLQKQHSWVYGDMEFSLAFLRGYFDVRGTIRDPVQSKSTVRLRIGVARLVAANELLELFSRVGLTNLGYQRAKRTREGIAGLLIHKEEDVSKFAMMIHSCVPKKEEMLSSYRKMPNSELVYTGDPEVLEAYDLVMKLREETGFGAWRLLRLPELQKFTNLNAVKVNRWINKGEDPRRNNSLVKGRYKLTREEIERGIILLDSGEES